MNEHDSRQSLQPLPFNGPYRFARRWLVVGQTLAGIVISHFGHDTRLLGVWGIYPGDQGAMKAALTIGGLWNVVDGARSTQPWPLHMNCCSRTGRIAPQLVNGSYIYIQVGHS
jgi:hypothetical protein